MHPLRVWGCLLGCLALAACDSTGLARSTHPQGVVLATRPLSARPYGVAISRDGHVYVARLDVDSVSYAVLPDTVFVGRVRVGTTPSHVAFNPAGTRAYVANQGTDNVSVVDVASGTTIDTIPMGSDAWNVIVSPDGAKLYATNDQGALSIISTATNTPDTTLILAAGDALRGLALSSNGLTLYVAGHNSGFIYVIATATAQVLTTINVGGTPQHMAVSLTDAELFVANEEQGVNVVTLSTGGFTTLAIGNAYGLARSPDGEQLYVTLPDSGSLKVVDRATRSVVNTLILGGRPRTVAFNARGDYAVVANENSAAVHFIR